MNSNDNPVNLDPLPPPPKGRNYTRMCIAALRRHAQKMPTLSGVADHVQAIDEDLGAWEQRARTLFSQAERLQHNLAQLDQLSQEKDRNIEGLFDDFASERDLWEEKQSQLEEHVQNLNHRVVELTENLDLSHIQLSDLTEQKQELENRVNTLMSEISSLRGFHEAVVRDLDSSEARLLAQVKRLAEDNQRMEDELVQAAQNHGNDLSAASQVIAQLRGENSHLSCMISELERARAHWNSLRQEMEERTSCLEQDLLEQSRRFSDLCREKDDQISQLSGENTSIERHCQQLHVQLEQANAKISERQDKLEALLLEVEQARFISSHLSEQLDLLTQENSQRKADSRKLEENIEGLLQQISQSQSRIATLIEQKDRAESDLDEAMAWASELEQLSNTASQRLDQANETIQGLTRASEEEAQAHSLAIADISSRHQKQVSELESNLERAEKKIQHLEEENGSHLREIEILGQSVDKHAQIAHDLRMHNLVKAQETHDFHSREVARLSSGYEADLFNAGRQIQDLSQMLSLCFEEGQIAYDELVQNHQEEIDLLEDRHSAQVGQLTEQLAQAQRKASDQEQQLARAQERISMLEEKLHAAQEQASMLPEMEQQLATVQEALFIQNREVQQMEAIVLQHNACLSDYDGSVPWDIRAWEGAPGREKFIPVPGVPQWFQAARWSASDFTKKKFPTHSSADREHLAMASGMPVAEFLSLPWVRPGTKKAIQGMLDRGERPRSTHGQWQTQSNGLAWRVNRFWSYLVEVSRTCPPEHWGVYLDGERLDMSCLS